MTKEPYNIFYVMINNKYILSTFNKKKKFMLSYL